MHLSCFFNTARNLYVDRDGLAVKIACWSLKYHGFDRKLIRSLVGKRVGRLWGEPVKVGAKSQRW